MQQAGEILDLQHDGQVTAKAIPNRFKHTHSTIYISAVTLSTMAG